MPSEDEFARCPDCGTQWGRAVLACPGCRRLVHAEAIAACVGAARDARREGRAADELESLREAVTLFPADARQAAKIRARMSTLSATLPAPEPPTPAPRSALPKWLAGLGAAGVLLWKSQAVLLFVVTKGKLLLAGFASWPTALSMLVSLGVYFAAWGLPFAAGLLASLYLHELGHVIALRRYGLPFSPPMFLPGIGAYVRLDKHPDTPAQDAMVGLAGPWAGLVAGLIALALHAITGHASLAAIAQVGAWINVFNLLPIGPLDGGRAFRALDRGQRGIAAAVLGLAALFTSDVLVSGLALVALLRVGGAAPPKGDWSACLQYAILIAALSALASIEVAPAP